MDVTSLCYHSAVGRRKILNGQMADKYVYIGRPSIWGNPFSVEEHGREECLQLYESYLRNNPDLLSQLPTLVGKTLACWCYPLPCHGDIIHKIMKEQGLI